MADKTGGPAFPLPGFQDNEGPVFGMTLRDYFAARAMQGFCDSVDPKQIAKCAYEQADAMLAARGDA